MNFERESWRPLFLRESVTQRGWNLVTRGLRVYLIRVAEDDGTLLKRCADPFELAASLAVHAEEVELVRGAIDTLLHDGFLQWAGDMEHPGRLGVDRLVKFGASPDVVASRPAIGDAEETAGERRRRLARERKARSRDRLVTRDQRDRERDMSRVTSVTDERDQRDPSHLPPHSPLSETRDKREKERERIRETPEGTARGAPPDPERASRVTSVTDERDQRDPSHGVTADKADGSNPRALGTNPRATGTNPRALEPAVTVEVIRRTYSCPDELQPLERHTARCAEFRLNVAEILGELKRWEPKEPVGDWHKALDRFIAQAIKNRSNGEAFVPPARGKAPRQGNHGMTGFEKWEETK